MVSSVASLLIVILAELCGSWN